MTFSSNVNIGAIKHLSDRVQCTLLNNKPRLSFIRPGNNHTEVPKPVTSLTTALN